MKSKKENSTVESQRDGGGFSRSSERGAVAVVQMRKEEGPVTKGSEDRTYICRNTQVAQRLWKWLLWDFGVQAQGPVAA